MLLWGANMALRPASHIFILKVSVLLHAVAPVCSKTVFTPGVFILYYPSLVEDCWAENWPQDAHSRVEQDIYNVIKILYIIFPNKCGVFITNLTYKIGELKVFTLKIAHKNLTGAHSLQYGATTPVNGWDICTHCNKYTAHIVDNIYLYAFPYKLHINKK